MRHGSDNSRLPVSCYVKAFQTLRYCVPNVFQDLVYKLASKKMKDRAFDLKEEIIREIKGFKA